MRIDDLPQPATLEPGAILYRDLTPSPADVLFRKLELDESTRDDEARTVEASLSSETKVERMFGSELLVHTPEAVNLERTRDGLPLLFGHNQDQPIGLVENVRIAGGRLRGLLRFSKNSRASEIWADVRDGFLKNVSIGYRIEKWEEASDSDAIRVTRWTPFEASVVSVAADPAVGVGRAAGAGLALREDGEGGPQLVASNERTVLAKVKRRAQDIRVMFAPFRDRGEEYRALEEAAIDDPAVSVEAVRRQLFELFGGDPQPLARDLVQAEGSANGADEQVRFGADRTGRRVEFVRDNGAEFGLAAADALLIRAGLPVKEPHAGAADLRHRRLTDFATFFVERAGVSVRGLSNGAIISKALSIRGLFSHTTSDFASLTEDVANKALQVGYSEAPETWKLWCKTGSLPDFKQGNRPALSAFGDLDVVYEGGEYKYGSFSDLKEVLTLLTYGKLFSITRQALINDDLNALAAVPAAMGRAASRKVGDLAYNVLINGTTATLNQDSKALFHADHGNFVAGGAGAAPSVATVDAGWTAMTTQTDPSGEAQLNVVPKFLIVPRALENSSRVLAVSRNDPAATTPNVANPFFDRLEVVGEARLDAADPAGWFLVADPAMVETVEVGFLDGQQSPFLETQNGWSTDGVAYKVRLDAVAAPLDFRGLYKNDGN